MQYLVILSSVFILTSGQCSNSPVKVSVSSSRQCHSSPKELPATPTIADALTTYLGCSTSPCNCTNDPTWTRVGYLDMTNSSQSCPSAWTFTYTNGVRACGRQPSNSGSCDSVFYFTRGKRYSQVCGRIIGYQYGDPEGFSFGRSIDTSYVHGVSLTHGSPRTHIWSFVNAPYETANAAFVCPCMLSNSSAWSHSVPSFVGNSYFCATGSRSPATSQLYTDNPLWDGIGCTGVNTCCQFNQPPWFCRSLTASTTDNLEVRICDDYTTGNENHFISNLELYIK